MKHYILKLTLVALVLSLATSLTAQSDQITNEFLQVRVRTCQETDRIQLWLSNMMNLETNVKIVSNDGEILYERTVDDEMAWGEKYHLDNFLEGDYSIVVEQHNTSFTKPFRFEYNAVSISPETGILAATAPKKPKLERP